MKDKLELEKRLEDHEIRIRKLESIIKRLNPATNDQKTQVAKEVVKIIATKSDTLTVPQLSMLALKLHGNLTRMQQKDVLENWGKPVGNYYRGGNYNRDLVRKAHVKVVGESEGEKIYALTYRGEIEADKLVEELKQSLNRKDNS